MSFNKVIGHDKTCAYFQELIKKETLPHAIMLEGKVGVGKTTLGNALSSAILCETETGDACGICRSCLKCHIIIIQILWLLNLKVHK